MAITKAEIHRRTARHHSRNTRAVDNNADPIDDMIRVELLNRYVGGPITIQLSNPLDPDVQAELEFRYEGAGWKIDFHSASDPKSYWITLE